MKTLQQIEKEMIIERLTELNGNKTKTAESLGITVKTMYNKLHEYGLFEQFQNMKAGAKSLDLTVANILNTQESYEKT